VIQLSGGTDVIGNVAWRGAVAVTRFLLPARRQGHPAPGLEATGPCQVPWRESTVRTERFDRMGDVSTPAVGSRFSASFSRRLRIALVAWLTMLGLDFLLNGAVFAGIYQGDGPFMLAPAEAARRIPFGYLAFLMLAAGMVEIAYRTGVRHVADGLRLGLAIGGAFGAIWALGLYSIATVEASSAIAFAMIWIALAALGSSAAAAGLATSNLRRLLLLAVLFDVACVALVIGLQSLGVVPATTAEILFRAMAAVNQLGL
jgi:hypothetical protein